MNNCTLVLEFNYGKPGEADRGTVWLFNGDGRSTLESATPLAGQVGWMKITGPIDYEAAASVHAALKRFFEASGVQVIDEGIAD